MEGDKAPRSRIRVYSYCFASAYCLRILISSSINLSNWSTLPWHPVCRPYLSLFGKLWDTYLGDKKRFGRPNVLLELMCILISAQNIKIHMSVFGLDVYA